MNNKYQSRILVYIIHRKKIKIQLTNLSKNSLNSHPSFRGEEYLCLQLKHLLRLEILKD